MCTQIVFERLCLINPDELKEEKDVIVDWDNLKEPVLYTIGDNGPIQYVRHKYIIHLMLYYHISLGYYR